MPRELQDLDFLVRDVVIETEPAGVALLVPVVADVRELLWRSLEDLFQNPTSVLKQDHQCFPSVEEDLAGAEHAQDLGTGWLSVAVPAEDYQ